MTLEPASPLCWPPAYKRTPATERRDSLFRITPAKAFQELLSEAERFGADLRVSMNAPRRRSDNLPYADALDDDVEDPGVVLYLTRDGQRLCFPCDTYRTMRENIRGITVAVEAFRSLDRHGVKQLLSRAMKSFVSLPPPTLAGRTFPPPARPPGGRSLASRPQQPPTKSPPRTATSSAPSGPPATMPPGPNLTSPATRASPKGKHSDRP